mmetsp:Transcript_71983/g.126858  ORF Transcript_71983/g.126858 Transcript_71983/m.126858 type:complete len:81 (-) Transcript_71983:227-469(-)
MNLNSFIIYTALWFQQYPAILQQWVLRALGKADNGSSSYRSEQQHAQLSVSHNLCFLFNGYLKMLRTIQSHTNVPAEHQQ